MERRRFIGLVLGGGLAALISYYLVTNFIKPVPTVDVDSEKVEIMVLAEGLKVPWSIEPIDMKRFIVSERGGRLIYIDDGSTSVIKEFNVASVAEAGLLGLALDPDFEAGRRYLYIYLSYYRGEEIVNKVVRVKLSKDYKNIESQENVVDGIPGARLHDGGRIRFGPDGHLYICTGDASQPMLAQDIDSLAGKILRVSKDGEAPPDNPFDSLVYSYGHRNPQGLDWYRDLFLANEHGPVGRDEINKIIPGGNYGWPYVAGYSGDERFVQPLYDSGQDTIAPSGASFIDGSYLGMDSWIYAIACLRGSMIFLFNPRDNSVYTMFKGEYGRLRDIKYLGDGVIVFSTSNRDGRGSPRPGDDKVIMVKL